MSWERNYQTLLFYSCKCGSIFLVLQTLDMITHSLLNRWLFDLSTFLFILIFNAILGPSLGFLYRHVLCDERTMVLYSLATGPTGQWLSDLSKNRSTNLTNYTILDRKVKLELLFTNQKLIYFSNEIFTEKFTLIKKMSKLLLYIPLIRTCWQLDTSVLRYLHTTLGFKQVAMIGHILFGSSLPKAVWFMITNWQRPLNV